MPQPPKSAREIFLDALETEPDIRATFVEHECRGDAALWREVNALLGVHDEPDSFLDSPRIRLGLANDAQTNRADSDTCQLSYGASREPDRALQAARENR